MKNLKRVKKIKIICLILIFLKLLAIESLMAQSSIEKRVVSLLNNSKTKFFSDSAFVPDDLILEIKKIIKDTTFCISNYGVPYNKTDKIINGKYCRRSVFFTATLKSEILVCYKRGGISSSTLLIYAKNGKRKTFAKLYSYTFSEKIEPNIQSILKGFKDRKYYITYKNGHQLDREWLSF